MSQAFSKLIKIFEDPRKILELSVGICLLLLMLIPAGLHWGERFELLFFDLHYQLRGERSFPQEINVIGFDEASLDKLGRWPWPRDKYALLLEFLSKPSFRPAVFAYDVLFESHNDQNLEGDKTLAYRAEKFKAPLIMSYFFEKGHLSAYEREPEQEKRLLEFALPETQDPPRNLDEYSKVSLPYESLAAASTLAFANTPMDRDGRTRRAQLLARYNGKIYPSMDLLTVLHYWDAKLSDIRIERNRIVIEKSKVGRKVIPINDQGEMLIHYYGTSKNIPFTAFIQVLETGAEWMKGKNPELLKTFKNKIVLGGATALGIGDTRATPFFPYEPGITLHAQTIANILEQNFLVRAPVWMSCLGLLILGLIAIGITMSFRITVSLPAMFGVGILYYTVVFLFFTKGLWLDVAIHELSLVLIFIGITSFRYFTALEELKRTQNQLIQAAKLASLGEMSAGIAHEFRNILNAVNLNVECLTRPNLPPEKMQKYSEMLHKIMKSSNQILEGLLLFARQSTSNKVKGNLKTVIEDTLPLLEKEMMRHQITLETDLKDTPEIAFDRGQISQVIVNMVNNARDAFKEDQKKIVKISLYEESIMLRIDIADNGSGIPPQVLKRLFQPFVTSKPPGKGTGLGLSVCHGIIRNHGGDIKVETAQGQGTTWHLYLPKE